MNRQQVITTWIRAMRIHTLIASISPVLIGMCIAYKHQNRCDVFLFMFTILTAIFLQIGTNLANDYFDFYKGADSFDRIGPKKSLQQGLISTEAMKYAFSFSFFIAILCGCYLALCTHPLLSLLLLLAVILGIFYTAGPYALSYNGCSDICVFLFFGMIATTMSCYVQTKQLYLEAWIAGMGPGAIATSLLTINNLRDHISDRKGEKNTLVVFFGEKFGKIEYVSFLSLSFAIPLFLYFSYPYNKKILFPLLAIPFGIQLVHNTCISTDYKENLSKTVLFFLLYTCLFVWGLLCQ